MRVAALYDVHGVPAALEAVLAEVEREQVDAIVFGGDLFLGPQPAEIAALVRTVDASFVRGNCDRSPTTGPTGSSTPRRLPGRRAGR
jgi:predicted phosphodiesterase